MASALFASLNMSAAEPLSDRGRNPSGTKLPVTEIILYTSGVGYFQRDGKVEGDASVDLRFKVDDINDLLKSMVVQDLDGGHISAVTYGSRDPLTKTLKSFALDLTTNPTLGQLLNQVRGERVEVSRPNPLVGVILGVERKTERLDEKRTVEAEYLNLLTAEGLQSLAMAQIQRVRLLNEELQAELQRALEVLALGHDTQKKTVTLAFTGSGARRVRVAYIGQTPVWKTSYRLVLDEKEPFLQGWAIVENTSDEEWENVQLSLVSGRPISFTMDLYQPLYAPRPVVQPELYTSLRPQVYSDSLEEKGVQRERYAGRALASSAPGGGGFGGGGGLGVQPAPPQAPAAAGIRAFGRSSVAGDVLADAETVSQYFFKATTAEAEGSQAGELFQYVIKTPVSLARQKSAMLPIISQNVQGEKVSIYNAGVHTKYALNGFLLKNSTPLHLMQGPITVFDAGAYAGDARIEDLAPGQDRLVSYALDLKTEVEPKSGDGQQELTAVKIEKGVLVATRRATEEKTYTIRNRDQKKKTVLVEHPFRSDWELAQPKEAAERTRDVYRFSVDVSPDSPATLTVREEKPLVEMVQLVESGFDVIAYYQRAKVVSPRVKEALEKVVTLRNRWNDTTQEIARREQRMKEISDEQGRIRENMTRLSQTSELYSRYLKKLDQQETELENLREQVETLRKTEAQQRDELIDYLLNLDVG